MAETVKGLADVLKKLDALGKDLDKEIESKVAEAALDMQGVAKRNVVSQKLFDKGKLLQSILASKLAPRTWKVAANATGLAPYAAYHEFGTGGLVDIPAELQDQASKFRGKGIRQVNIRPRPYFYPAFLQQRRKLLESLEDLLDRETKKI